MFASYAVRLFWPEFLFRLFVSLPSPQLLCNQHAVHYLYGGRSWVNICWMNRRWSSWLTFLIIRVLKVFPEWWWQSRRGARQHPFLLLGKWQQGIRKMVLEKENGRKWRAYGNCSKPCWHSFSSLFCPHYKLFIRVQSEDRNHPGNLNGENLM